MAQILNEQTSIFEKETKDNNCTQFTYKEGPAVDRPVIEEKKFSIQFIQDKDGQTIEIAVYGHYMNEEIYKREMQALNQKYLNYFRENKSGDKDFLLTLGKLSYELSRLYPLKRGTNAVNEWLIQGIAKTFRNMTLGHVSIEGIPFDLYAFTQQNINTYAEKFSIAVEEQLNKQKLENRGAPGPIR